MDGPGFPIWPPCHSEPRFLPMLLCCASLAQHGLLSATLYSALPCSTLPSPLLPPRDLFLSPHFVPSRSIHRLPPYRRCIFAARLVVVSSERSAEPCPTDICLPGASGSRWFSFSSLSTSAPPARHFNHLQRLSPASQPLPSRPLPSARAGAAAGPSSPTSQRRRFSV